MKLSGVIPCYNERDSVRTIIDAVRAAPYKNKEIILVDDFSKDGTRETPKNEIAPIADLVLCHEANQGKGAAVRTGVEAATGGPAIMQDADLEYDPKEYGQLVQPILDDKAGAVWCSKCVGCSSRASTAST